MHTEIDVREAAKQKFVQCVPLATEPGWLADRCSVSQQLGALQTHTTDTFLFISHTTNVFMFKFCCNIFIGVRIIKEMPGSVARETRRIKYVYARIGPQIYTRHTPYYI